MPRIRLLDQKIIDQIAAGEVVERPASCVKELVENAIDAGAKRITVEIRDGGIKLMRISDDGCGISAEDLDLAFLRHATSKIADEEDLEAIGTLGFRGEALSSIAAVSRVELITKTPEQLSAVRLKIEGGAEHLREEVGAPDGTTIIVRDLFFNTPARAKFLKSAITEASRVGDVMEQLILSNTEIAFSFIVNGRQKLASTGSGRLKDALYHIYGRDTASLLLPVDFEEEGIRISGMIGKPQLSRGNRNFENYYVNGRYIKNKIIERAVEDGFGTKLMQHQFPFTCFMIEADPRALDVNVHPSKMEVRFSDEKKIYRAVRRAVEEALHHEELILISRLTPSDEGKGTDTKEHAPEPFEKTAAREALEKSAPFPNEPEHPLPEAEEVRDALSSSVPLPEQKVFPEERACNTDSSDVKQHAGTVSDAERHDAKASDTKQHFAKMHYEQQSFAPAFMSEDAKPFRRMIGVAFQTYWICEYGKELFLFDQHAAHERVLYERFMKAYTERKLASQSLMPALTLTLDAREEAALLAGMDAFTELGFELEEFGPHTWLLRAVPYTIGNIGSEKLFRELLDQLDFSGKLKDNRQYIRIIATEACKAAVKGGERLSLAEAGTLLDELMQCEDPYHCPHGRPTIISFSEKELEKRFKRIV